MRAVQNNRLYFTVRRNFWQMQFSILFPLSTGIYTVLVAHGHIRTAFLRMYLVSVTPKSRQTPACIQGAEKSDDMTIYIPTASSRPEYIAGQCHQWL